MCWRLILLLAGALIVSSALLTAPAHAAFPGANGKIAFTSSIDPNPPYSVAEPGEIYTMNPDGTGVDEHHKQRRERQGPGLVARWHEDSVL